MAYEIDVYNPHSDMCIPPHACVTGSMQGLNVLHDGGLKDGDVFVKLLTNRAACHLSLARPLKALQDCTMAVQVR